MRQPFLSEEVYCWVARVAASKRLASEREFLDLAVAHGCTSTCHEASKLEAIQRRARASNFPERGHGMIVRKGRLKKVYLVEAWSGSDRSVFYADPLDKAIFFSLLSELSQACRARCGNQPWQQDAEFCPVMTQAIESTLAKIPEASHCHVNWIAEDMMKRYYTVWAWPLMKAAGH